LLEEYEPSSDNAGLKSSKCYMLSCKPHLDEEECDAIRLQDTTLLGVLNLTTLHIGILDRTAILDRAGILDRV